MRWKLLVTAVFGAVMMCSPVQGNAFAADFSAYEEYEKAIGLIEKCSLTCTSSIGGVINITAKTQVASEMEEVGYKNITVQYSQDGENWIDEKTINDLTETGRRYYNINNMKVEVEKEGYYRVVCVHYAKGVPFGETEPQIQAVINTSAVSFVKKREVADVEETKEELPASTTSTKVSTTDAVSKTTTTGSTKTVKSTSSKTDSPPTGDKGTAAASAILAAAAVSAFAVRKKNK